MTDEEGELHLFCGSNGHIFQNHRNPDGSVYEHYHNLNIGSNYYYYRYGEGVEHEDIVSDNNVRHREQIFMTVYIMNRAQRPDDYVDSDVECHCTLTNIKHSISVVIVMEVVKE